MVPTLNFAERRVLGVLVEKGYTTPQQYPLTINALVTGSNQQSCRIPVANIDENAVLDALDSLREKGLVTLVRTTGGRTDRYKQRIGDTLGVDGPEAAVLAELLLRGPQTDGELRQRANRMVRIPDLAALATTLRALEERDPPLARRLSPPERRRGAKYAHTLYPPQDEPTDEESTEHESVEPGAAAPSTRAAGPPSASSTEVSALREEMNDVQFRLAVLESVVATLGGVVEPTETADPAEPADENESPDAADTGDETD